MSGSVLVALSFALAAALWPCATAQAQGVNTFNRLHTPPSNRNAPPTSDGVHDPSIEGASILQSPREAFADLPGSVGGNYVNWVEALQSGKITPRYDRESDEGAPEPMDLDVVREVKGSMPDAVFPHLAHTEWIDCPVCHPALFEPQAGANTMTMAEIMTGQKCGICHGSVAFPVSDCKRCHYKAKSNAAAKVRGEDREVQRTATREKRGFRLPWQD